jgi:hypothetical protein
MTERQLEIWRLRFKGFSKAEVGRRLGITRQAVYDAEKYTLGKVEQALIHTAESNMIEARYVDSAKGILLGYSPSSQQKVIITFSARNGVQTWHYQQPDCSSCKWVERCRSRLISEAEERDLSLSDEEKRRPPSELAQRIFSSIILGLDE